MSSRPEVLFPLFASLETLPGIGPKTATLLPKIGVQRPVDLLFTLPTSVIDRRRRNSVQGAEFPTVLTVEITVERHRPSRSRGRPYVVDVRDSETAFQLVFFHARTDWLEQKLPVGAKRIVSGQVELWEGVARMAHPDYILPTSEGDEIPPFEPVYPLTQGLSQKMMRRANGAAVERCPHMAEWIDPDLRSREDWPAFGAALQGAHSPESASDALPTTPARRRLAYDEMFAHQVTLALVRQRRRRRAGRSSVATGRLQKAVIDALPYRPTGAQMRAVAEIQEDMAAETRMNRLLQGDVGAGKTFVALMGLLTAVEAGGQGVMMAPTEILAQQHVRALRDMAAPARVVVDILTGRDKGRERERKLTALAAGDIQILLGTHAVFQKDVEFADLRLAVIDEQHRFGVSQRMALGEKGAQADVLVMTATPIPRSLSLANYGDLDVSVLDEKPPGRTPVTTALVSLSRMEEVVGNLRRAMEEGRQAYWVCPLVGESEVSDLAAAEERFKVLRAALGEGQVGLVHGQLPVDEKDVAMARFASGETKVLVATTVIEVGVDVPNASIMVIERAESFGLAQLHQLRGRVGRGAAKSTCLLLYQAPLGETGRRRLEILRETEDGFVIAEEDLAMRGAGDVLGTAQSGLPRFRVADLERQAGLMQLAQRDARHFVESDPTLETERGSAVRLLLWLLSQDRAISMISVG